MRRNLELKYGNKFGANNYKIHNESQLVKKKKMELDILKNNRVIQYKLLLESYKRKLKKAERRSGLYSEYLHGGYFNFGFSFHRFSSSVFDEFFKIDLLYNRIKEKLDLPIEEFIKETSEYNDYLKIVYDERHIKAIEDIKAKWKHRCFVRKMQKELNEKTITKTEKKGKI